MPLSSSFLLGALRFLEKNPINVAHLHTDIYSIVNSNNLNYLNPAECPYVALIIVSELHGRNQMKTENKGQSIFNFANPL